MTAVAVGSAAIFDFDGTIADSLGEVLAAYNSVAGELAMPPVSHDDLAEFRHLGPRETIQKLRVPLWKVPRVMTTVRAAMRGRMAGLRPFDGMIEALHALWQRGVKTAIVSSNSHENVSEFLARHGIDRFEALSCGVSLFGKARRLRSIAARAEFAGARLFYVGDEVRDVTAATEAGMSSLAVTWGYGERAALEAHGPVHVVSEPAQLVSILAPC
jgi:phosphoglycolate phosphatase